MLGAHETDGQLARAFYFVDAAMSDSALMVIPGENQCGYSNVVIPAEAGIQ